MSRGPGCWSTFYSAQNSPHKKNYLVLTGTTLWIYDLCNLLGPSSQVEDSCHSLKVLNNFILNLICEWIPLGQWSMPVSRGNMCNRHALHSLLAHGHTGLPYVMSTEFQWIRELWNFSNTQNEYKSVILHLRLSKQILRTSSEDIFFWICFQCRKKAMTLV